MARSHAIEGIEQNETGPREGRFLLPSSIFFIIIAVLLALIFLHPVRYFRSRSAKSWIIGAELSAQSIFNDPRIVYVYKNIFFDGFAGSGNALGHCAPVALMGPDAEIQWGWMYLALPLLPLTEEIWVDPATGRFVHFLTSTQSPLKDEIWADPATGRFVHLLTSIQSPFLAQSFDGEYLYTYNPIDQEEVIVRPMDRSVAVSEIRTRLMEIMTGLPMTFQTLQQEKHLEYFGEEMVYGQGRTRVFQLAIPGPAGLNEITCQLKFRKSDRAIAQVACQVGRQRCWITPLCTRRDEKPPRHWDLRELANRRPN